MVNVDEWMRSGKYLPKFMRDFHNQKDLFKAIHQTIIMSDYTKEISFVAGQCYVIDVFLWYMAKRGWTLQRTHTRGQFRDLEADIREQNELRSAAQVNSLKAWLSGK